MTPTPRSARASAERDRRRHRPSARRARRRLPPEVPRPSQTRPPTRDSLASPAIRLDRTSPAPDPGAGDASGVSVSMGLRPPAGCGAGQLVGCLAPWSAARWGPGRVRSGDSPGRDPSSAPIASLTIRSSVTQASRTSRVCVVVASDQSLYELRGGRRAVPVEGRDASTRSRRWAARRVARRRGPRHRREA